MTFYIQTLNFLIKIRMLFYSKTLYLDEIIVQIKEGV